MSKRVFSGVVEKGTGRAGRLGFPTINIAVAGAGVSGVYAAKAVVGGKTHYAAAFADPVRGIVEAFILDFSKNIYGEAATIELIHKLRDTMQFGTDAELSRAIAADIQQVRDYFLQHS